MKEKPSSLKGPKWLLYDVKVKLAGLTRKKKKQKIYNKKLGQNLFLFFFLLFPVAQFLIFYVGVAANTMKLAFQKYDGENGAYRLFAMETHTCEGPAADGTYAWIDIDWEVLEKTLLAGGYAPRFACIYAQAIPVLKELCRYLDIAADMEA